MSSFHSGGATPTAKGHAGYSDNTSTSTPQKQEKKDKPVSKKPFSVWGFLFGSTMAEIAKAKEKTNIVKEQEKTERIETRTGATTENLKTAEKAVDDIGKNTNALVDDATDTAVDIVNSPNAPAIAGMIAGAAAGNPAGVLSSLQSMGAGAASTSGTGTFHAQKPPPPKKEKKGISPLLMLGGLGLLLAVSNNGSKK